MTRKTFTFYSKGSGHSQKTTNSGSLAPSYTHTLYFKIKFELTRVVFLHTHAELQ